MGHTLGIWGHSDQMTDIMHSTGDSGEIRLKLPKVFITKGYKHNEAGLQTRC